MTAPVWTPCTVTLGALKPWAANPRLSTKTQARRLLASFDKFGQVESIAIGPDNEVYDGHQRLSALLTLHSPDYTIDARRSDRALTDDERRELVVALHVGAVGQWDWQQLAAWDGPQLQAWGMDGETLKTWNSDAGNLREMLAANKSEIVDAEPQIDRAAELREKWQTERGQLWRIGEHRLLCGDSTKREDVERVMGGEKALLFETDPPYGVDYIKTKSGIPDSGYATLGADYTDIEADELKNEKMKDWLIGVFNVWTPHLKEGCAWYLWHPMLTQGYFAAAAAAAAVIIHRQIIWVKSGFNLTRSGMYHWAHELCFYGWSKGHVPKWYGEKNQRTVWNIDRQDEKQLHPTSKPPELWFAPMKNHLLDGEICAEPFAGSGSQYIAGQNLNRRVFGSEIDPKYCAVVLERMATAFPGIEISRIES